MDQLVTREGDLFQVSNQRGDFSPDHAASGLFTRDTRFLSRFEVLVNGEKPHLLTASAADNYIQRVFAQAAIGNGPQKAVSIQRRRVLYGGVLYERISVTSYECQNVAVWLELRFGADFADLFEVRGVIRQARGEQLPARVEPSSAILGYRGLDGVLRQTELRFSVRPAEISADCALWQLSLPPRGTAVIDVAVLPAENGAFPIPVGYEEALAALVASYTQWRQQCTAIESDNELLNRVLERSVLDVRVLRADLGHGPFVVAGIPWFAVPFGRDSLIVAAQALALHPELARGTLRTMAALQGREVHAWRQEEPGKILHEMRRGEMANLDEVPFARYYGSVDSTPLFLVLLCEHYAWTGDLELVRELLPNVRAALSWLDTYGDSDGDGFLEYRADPGKGLVVQSWKDTSTSMSHRDGHPAASPVAISEVQGYAYDARCRLAPILAKLGETELSQRLIKEAQDVKIGFNDAFWMQDRQYLAIALDGTKAQVGTVASDAGQCLWSGIVDAPKAVHVARRLVAPDLFSGWGIRTLSTDETTYSPMSYHNGSVWPHDNSLCVLGLKRYGYDREANIVATGLLEAAVHFASFRLPELFCGYSREEGIPVAYPVACAPQAWAAATPIALVQGMLGLSPDAAASLLRLRPSLPDWVGRLALRGLRVGSAILDVEVTREGTRATVRDGRLDVVVE
jgi:glycogen debranching enzyme